ncbi:MAG: hypothetical protein R3F61_12690 [Myxococcota bacterium]
MTPTVRTPLSAATLVLLVACKGGAVNSDAEAEAATLGLEGAIERALALGFAGFAAASSANIPEQSDAGDVAGTMVVTGQVDQGNSDNKGMRLNVALTDYADLETFDTDELDAIQIAYDTDPAALPSFDLSLRDIPDGTLTGSIAGDFLLSGDLDGVVTLALTLDGVIVPDGTGTQREEGTTAVTGTATNSGGGTYTVDLTL